MKIYGLNVETYKAYNNETRCLNFVYLDGMLEKKNGFDLVAVTEETYQVLTSCNFGVFDVEVVLHNGSEERGILFYWHDKHSRWHGLIVGNTDVNRMKNAVKKFNSRSCVI